MLRSIQPFLGSLNYSSRFMVDFFAVYAPVLCQLRETDFYEIYCMDDRDTIVGDLYRTPIKVRDHELTLREDDRDLNGRTWWEEAKIALAILRAKISTTPTLRYFDPDRLPVIVVYAIKEAVSASCCRI